MRRNYFSISIEYQEAGAGSSLIDRADKGISIAGAGGRCQVAHFSNQFRDEHSWNEVQCQCFWDLQRDYLGPFGPLFLPRHVRGGRM